MESKEKNTVQDVEQNTKSESTSKTPENAQYETQEQKITRLQAELYEREEAFKKKENLLLEKERALNNRELQAKTLEKLKKNNIPEEALPLVNTKTEESIEQSVALIAKLLKRSSYEAPAIGNFEPELTSYKQRAAVYLRQNY
ncbi:MAG: hypothetical protein Q4E07_03730 [Eubacteriales bacterium]|nr:hypothetical protein [Eubacteriales bacterium]